jgi:hypothetical protein
VFTATYYMNTHTCTHTGVVCGTSITSHENCVQFNPVEVVTTLSFINFTAGLVLERKTVPISAGPQLSQLRFIVDFVNFSGKMLGQ